MPSRMPHHRTVSNVPTDRRAVVKLLLRSSLPQAGAPSTRRIGGYMVIVLGDAKAEDWADYQAGDLEAVVWTTPRQVAQVAENLRKCEGVVATKNDG